MIAAATFVEYLVFFAAALMILGGAIGVIALRNPVHAALGLVLTLFGVAVQFVAQEAHFLAAVQVIVYAGAIVVLFLFVIMLLGVDKAQDLSVEPLRVQRPLAAVMGVGLLALLVAAFVRADSDGALTAPAVDVGSTMLNPGTGLDVATTSSDGLGAVLDPGLVTNDANVRQLAENLFSDHVFAFELTSVLLIVAVAGTVLMTRRWPRNDAEASSSESGADASDRGRSA